MLRNALAGKKTFGMVSVPKDQPNVKVLIFTIYYFAFMRFFKIDNNFMSDPKL